jgi:Predicted transcriptional regulators
MNILIKNSSDQPIYDQISSQMKNLILTGVLKEGEALPSIRNLAKELRISVITSQRAYEELEKDGFIVTVPGKGSFVATVNSMFYREEQMKKIDEHLTSAITIARLTGITEEELTETLALLYKE